MKQTIIFLAIALFCYNSVQAKKFTYRNGDYYEGDWSSGNPLGKGILKCANGNIYDGKWGNELKGRAQFFEGRAQIKDELGNQYDGFIKSSNFQSLKDSIVEPRKHKNFKYEGSGTMKYVNGDIYNGNWNHSYKNGEGTMYFSNGDIYDGEWNQDKISGFGKMKYVDGSIYEGKWIEGKWSGKGILTKNDGSIIDSEWINGEDKVVVEKRKEEERLQKELQKKENDKILLARLKTDEAARLKRQTNKNKGFISGVITYKFNNFSKADIGSEVVVVKITPEMNIECIDMYNNLQTAKKYGIAKQVESQLQESGADYSTARNTTELMYGKEYWNLDNIDKSAFGEIFKYRCLDGALKTAVDGNGKFDITVENGKYCVIITSKNIKKPSMAETLGAIDISFIIIENGETESVSHEFK